MGARVPVGVAANLHRCRIEVGALGGGEAVGLAAPGPECAVGFDGEDQVVAHADVDPVGVGRDAGGDGNTGAFFGLGVVPAPEPQGAVFLLGDVLN